MYSDRLKESNIYSFDVLISDVSKSIFHWRIPLIDSTSFDKSATIFWPEYGLCWWIQKSPIHPQETVLFPARIDEAEPFHTWTWCCFGKGTERPRQKQWLLLRRTHFNWHSKQKPITLDAELYFPDGSSCSTAMYYGQKWADVVSRFAYASLLSQCDWSIHDIKSLYCAILNEPRLQNLSRWLWKPECTCTFTPALPWITYCQLFYTAIWLGLSLIWCVLWLQRMHVHVRSLLSFKRVILYLNCDARCYKFTRKNSLLDPSEVSFYFNTIYCKNQFSLLPEKGLGNIWAINMIYFENKY